MTEPALAPTTVQAETTAQPNGGTRPRELGDFTAGPRMLAMVALALGIGALAAPVAVALQSLIALFTQLFFYQRLSLEPATPEGHALGPWVIAVPVLGALIVGLLARYGSEKIRGHGIPEAIEAILMRGSRVEPRVALLKPLSAAISIGSGGPFGAEGPIIMTGGAFGSLIAQFFHLTSAERKTLLVAGAAAGMSATFAAPVASAMLAVELLLFELKPRSFVPVALASAMAALLRHFMMGAGPLFPVPEHAAFVGPEALACCALVGVAVGMTAAAMTVSVYGCEDAFSKLRIHWMWWPALGAVIVGLGGWLEPRALGVGYANIEALLQGSFTTREVISLLLVKWAIWSIFLGSGTSGGVLAPLLMIGAALGHLLGLALPDQGVGFWPLVAMGAILAGMMRAPFTAVIFSFELTGDLHSMLPLLVAGASAHCFTVLTMRRSILTEKIARRGFHISREYAIDPLEVLFVRDVMETTLVALPVGSSHAEVTQALTLNPEAEQRLYPWTDAHGLMVGVASRSELEGWLKRPHELEPEAADTFPVGSRTVLTAHPDEPLRVVAYRMAESGKTRLPVVERDNPRELLGFITLRLLLKARLRHLEEEERRERVLPLHVLLPPILRRGRRQQAR